MKAYLLTCGCSAVLTVGPGQAGAEVICPRCNAPMAVPRLGDLARLPSADAATIPARAWSAAHGCLLGGVLVAVLAAAVAAYLGSAPPPVTDEPAIRANVASLTNAEAYRAWQYLAKVGVWRPSLADEERMVQRAKAARSVAGVLWIVTAIGAAAAIAGGLALNRGGTSAR